MSTIIALPPSMKAELLNSVPVAMAFLDLELTILWANVAFQEAT